MGKVITSPVKKFEGSVTLSDPLTFPQLLGFQESIDSVQEAVKASEEEGATITIQKMRYLLLPGIMLCVEEWDLKGMPENPTPDTFPATPMLASGELIDWLREEITVLLLEAEPDPKKS